MVAVDIPCCPELEEVDCCDRLHFKYVLTNRAVVGEEAGAAAGRDGPGRPRGQLALA